MRGVLDDRVGRFHIRRGMVRVQFSVRSSGESDPRERSSDSLHELSGKPDVLAFPRVAGSKACSHLIINCLEESA